MLQIKDLFVGNTDAKNELLDNSSESITAFKEGFLMPDNLVLSDFIDGRKYFITGLKGTGKTALLRYISIFVEETLDANSAFVLFKSDIKEEDRAKLSRTADIINRKSVDDGQFKDYESAWLLFLFRQLIHICEHRNLQVFEDDATWRDFKKCVISAYNKDDDVQRLFPAVKRGKVSVDTKVIKAEADIEIQKLQGDKRINVKFASLVNRSETLFKELIPGHDKLYVFLDELELSLVSKKQYHQDIEMIRDLILAIYQLNSISRANKYPLFFITGVRKEVLAATSSVGKEINKPISDFGISLRWQQSGGNVSEHPLIRIITKRLIYAEQSLPNNERADENKIWSRYFPETINRKPTQTYILNKTWYRPRDIVRLLGIARQQFPFRSVFTQDIFEAINKDYSIESWTEQEEELQSCYSKKQINGIKHILMGVTCPFTFNEITSKAESAKPLYSDVNELLQTHKLSDLLDHLYSLGVIGNSGKNAMRYSFRGDEGLLFEQQMTIHPALWNVLSARKKLNRRR